MKERPTRPTVDMSELTKTSQKRLAQHRDRWSSWGQHSGLVALSDKPTPDELREIELFAEFDDDFLESISPDVSIALWAEGTVLFEQGTYLDLAFFVLAGEVEIALDLGADWERSQALPIFDEHRTSRVPAPSRSAGAHDTAIGPRDEPARPHHETSAGHQIPFLATLDFELDSGSTRLGPGELFGEIGAMSGWPQSTTVRTATECRLVQIRVPALRALKRRSRTLADRLDGLYRRRALHGQLRSTPLFRGLGDLYLQALEEKVELLSLEPGDVLVREGDTAEALFLVRAGFLKLSQHYGEGELVATYLSKGMTFGEVELLIEGIDAYEMTATSVEYAEMVKIPFHVVHRILDADPEIREALWRGTVGRLKEVGASRQDPGRSAFVEKALESGLVQGNSILMIDLESCTRCDDCVRACAETHGGRPRFVREGDRLDHFLVPRSCYHCRDPVCLIGCPTGAIARSGAGEWVAITDEICIGCGTCARNCPYDAIVMHETGETWPDDTLPAMLRGHDRRVASKCDLCGPTGHDPACVSNCPQGCAIRVSSVDEIRELLRDG
ncbi:MAG: cyclic nucleotide-binding domain-containing protein [Acidobacteriota bacterium]